MLQINLVEANGYNYIRLVKLKEALEIIKNVLNSDRFKEEVLHFSFHYRKGIFGSMVDTEYTNHEVYHMIMNANEIIGNISAGTMDLYLHLKEGSRGSVVGFGYQNKKEIYTYQDMFDRLEKAEIANHITHEWMHKLGFTHAEYTTFLGKRNNSVPYAIGNMVEDLSKHV